MKKLIAISIVLVFLSSVAFAQEEKALSIGFSAGAYTDLLFFTKDSGADAEGNTDYYDNIAGSLNFFNSSNIPMPGTSASLTFTHTGEYHEASLQLSTGDLLGRIMDSGDVTWQNFLDNGIGDWYIKGSAGMFDGYVGNTGYGGAVSSFGNFDDFMGIGLNDFGVYAADGFHGSNNLNVWGDDLFALGASFGSFKLALGSSLNHDGWNAPGNSASSINAAFLFSGIGIANMINFDLFYGVAGGDNHTGERGSGGAWMNQLGAYVGLSLMDGGLGIGVGYTGRGIFHETYNKDNDLTVDKPLSISSPFYSGISIHVNFTGIDRLGITLNNNIGFVGATGEKDDSDTRVTGIMRDHLGEKESESGFSLHNALAVSFSLSDSLTLTGQLANLLQTFTHSYNDQGDKEAKSTHNQFQLAVIADYAIGKVSVGAGLSMGIESNSGTFDGKDTAKGSTFTFGIPVYFTVSF